MDCDALPKGLIPFHADPDGARYAGLLLLRHLGRGPAHDLQGLVGPVQGRRDPAADEPSLEAQLAIEHFWAGALRRAVIDGDVEKPFKIGIDELIRKMTLEERLYRHRCVEAWSMTVPWSGNSTERGSGHCLSNARCVRAA